MDIDEDRAKIIKWLDLKQGNPVMTIEGAEKLTELTRACLAGNHPRMPGRDLTKVPRWIEKLPAIEIVNLRSNNLETLPSWLLQINTLKRIFATCNDNLKRINFSELKSTNKLVELELHFCNIQSLPDDFFHHRLVNVNLFNNKGKFICEYLIWCDVMIFMHYDNMIEGWRWWQW